MAKHILSRRSFFLQLICILAFSEVMLVASSLPKDSVPKAKTELENLSIYIGNITLSRRIEDDYYVGSVNRFLIFDLQNNFQVKNNETWEPNEENKNFCTNVLQKGSEECLNYISVIEENDINKKLLVCGTNANRPSCRYYNHSRFDQYDDINGIYKAPFAAGQHNQAIFANGSLYAGTVSETMGSKSVISRSGGHDDPTLRRDLVTGDSVSRYLNEPDFISTFYIGEKVFFFLRETAVEYNNCGQTRYSRVARVCTKDKGGSNHVLEDIWTTFLKARMVCSIPGDFPFYFNEIQDTFKDLKRDVFYGVFTTPENSIPGSAICMYDLDTINRIFDVDGKFKEQETAQHAWLPVPESDVPEPRPGSCVDDSTSLSNSVLLFVKDHTLMHDYVEPNEDQGPLFTMTREDYRFTQIVVDKVAAKGSQEYDVMFIGTDSGKVLKVVLMRNSEGKLVSNLLDEITIGDPANPEPIVSMELIDDRQYILIGTPTTISRLNVQHCHKLRKCACVQDPYCGWSPDSSDSEKCRVYEINQPYEQNVENIRDCPQAETPAPSSIPCECPEFPTAHSPTDLHMPTRKEVTTTEQSNFIQPEMPESSKVIGTTENCQTLTIITICGWTLLAILGVVLIIYFLRRRAKNSHCFCYKDRKMDVSARQEQEVKLPETPNSITFVMAENIKNNQQEKPADMHNRPKPSVPPKPTNYNRSSLNPASPPPPPPSQSTGRESIKDINRELKHCFIHSNGGSSLSPQRQMILPVRGEKIAQV